MAQVLLFAANDGDHGTELFAMDVGGQSSRLVKDIRGTTFLDSGIAALTGAASLGRLAVFQASDGMTGGEIWVSDGTMGGTHLLRDIRVGEEGSYPRNFTTSGDLIFFTATEPDHGSELWVTDGTTGGTRLVRDVAAGQGWSNIASLVPFGGGVMFVANDGLNGYELWFSDGTFAGTRLVKDVNSIGSGGIPAGLTSDGVMGNQIFYSATGEGTGQELWVSDGTSEGTHIVKDITPGLGGSNLGEIQVAGKLAFFSAYDPVNGYELWRSDGTDAGTMRLTDVKPGVDYGSPSGLSAFGSKLLYVDVDNSGWEPWVSDGTTAGTFRLADIAAGSQSSVSSFSQFYSLGTTGRAVFLATDGTLGRELWVTDGTVAGTRMLKDINQGFSSSDATNFFQLGGLLYFQATDTDLSAELWVTDGTVEGTKLVSDTWEGAAPGFATPLAVIDMVPKGSPGPDVLNGTEDDDKIDGKGGADVINGLGGADFLKGGGGKDHLNGGAGDDILRGDLDADVLTGNAGADLFAFLGKFGRDVITDFGKGADVIDLAGRGLTFDDLDIRGAQGGRDTVIDLGANEITLKRFNAVDLTAEMFDFGG